MIDPATVAAGTPVPPFSRVGSFEAWTRYAAVNHEIAGHHMDDEVARREGFPGAFAMAPLTFSYVQTMLREWVGAQGRIVTVAIRLRSPFLRGRTLTATGEVREVDRITSPGRIRTPVYSTSSSLRMLARVRGSGRPSSGSGHGRPARTMLSGRGSAVIQANGLKSSGATMPPNGVAAANSSSQNRRGGRSGK